MKRKFTSLQSLLTIAAVFLAVCSGTASATASTSSGLSTANRLAVGTLKLEDTSQPVTTTQAGQLLTLWEGYQSLSQSDTSSQVELDALLTQIQAVMSSEQLQAIETMGLTDQSISDVLLSIGNSTIASAPVTTPGSTSLSQVNPGAGPGGMPGGAGDSVMNAIIDGGTKQSTPAATQSSSNAGTTQVSSMLLRALVKMLETRSKSES
jgi:hypothetical protein